MVERMITMENVATQTEESPINVGKDECNVDDIIKYIKHCNTEELDYMKRLCQKRMPNYTKHLFQ